MPQSDFVAIDVQGLRELQELLKDLPPRVIDGAVEAVSARLVNILRNYPTQVHVSRATAYPDAPAGPGFFSDKQRRWFFANLGEMQIPYRRTQGFAKGWKTLGEGRTQMVVNETPYGPLLVGDEEQSRMAKLGGWNKISSTIAEHDKTLSDAAEGAAKKVIKEMDREARNG